MIDTCVCCGSVVPEGRMVCPQCEFRAHSIITRPMMDTSILRKEKRNGIGRKADVGGNRAGK